MNFKKDFSKETVKGLKNKGIELVGATWAPSVNGDFSNGETVYKLNDNGTLRIRTYLEVKALGEA